MNITDMYADKFLFKSFYYSSDTGGSPFSLTIGSKATTTVLANLGSFIPQLSGKLRIKVGYHNHGNLTDSVSFYLYDGDTVVASGENKEIQPNVSSSDYFYINDIIAYKKYTMKIKSTRGTTTVTLQAMGSIVEQSNKYMVVVED